MIYNIRYPFNIKTKIQRHKGTAIMETAVGLLVLMPVFLLLFDVIALVIGQTINDDLAKNATWAAAQCSTATGANGGATAAQNYLDTTLYTGPNGLVSQATISQFIWNTTNPNGPPIVTVGTQIIVNLPVPVPLGGPKSQVMNAQATATILGISPSQ